LNPGFFLRSQGTSTIVQGFLKKTTPERKGSFLKEPSMYKLGEFKEGIKIMSSTLVAFTYL